MNNKSLDHVFSEIKSRVQKAKAETPGPYYAAFDADGTLWNIDLGELFFDYQIQNCGFELPPDPWSHYLDTKKVDTPKAYLWLAQINAGTPLNKVRAWAEAAFLGKSEFPFLNFNRRLIEFLHTEGVAVYVVTASVKWAVEPGAKRLGISAERVLGVKTFVRNGVVSPDQDGPITWREGKRVAILEATNGVPPILAAGNTTGDVALIETATHVKLAVLSQNPGEHLFETEMQLQAEAAKRGWTCLDLSSPHDLL